MKIHVRVLMQRNIARRLETRTNLFITNALQSQYAASHLLYNFFINKMSKIIYILMKQTKIEIENERNRL